MPAVRPAVLRLLLLQSGALLHAAACGQSGSETRPSSGSGASAASLATPGRPAASAARDSASLPPGVPPDSAARLRTLLDSVAALDESFQRERAALNAEAAAMQSLDRRSAGYAQRFDAFRARQLAAEQLRETRDRTRRRAEAARARLTERAAAAR